MTVTLDERLWCLIIGATIGFTLGYITRYLQKIERSIVAMEKNVHKNRDEAGFMRKPLVADIAVVLVVLLTAFASFQSQVVVNQVRANDKDDDRQDLIIAASSDCNSTVLNDAIKALNERTTYTAGNNQANVDLVVSQKEFLGKALADPPPSGNAIRLALQDYFDKTDLFVGIAEKSKKKALKYKYPKENDLEKCIKRKVAANE